MKYEIAQQLKTREYQPRYGRRMNATVKHYEWTVTATGLTWQAAKALRKTLKNVRIYPVRGAAA